MTKKEGEKNEAMDDGQSLGVGLVSGFMVGNRLGRADHQIGCPCSTDGRLSQTWDGTDQRGPGRSGGV